MTRETKDEITKYACKAIDNVILRLDQKSYTRIEVSKILAEQKQEIKMELGHLIAPL